MKYYILKPKSGIDYHFKPEAITAGVIFRKRVPIIQKHPDCFERVSDKDLPDKIRERLYPKGMRLKTK